MLVSAIGYLNNRAIRESEYNNSVSKVTNNQGFGTYKQTSIPDSNNFIDYIKSLLQLKQTQSNSNLNLLA